MILYTELDSLNGRLGKHPSDSSRSSTEENRKADGEEWRGVHVGREQGNFLKPIIDRCFVFTLNIHKTFDHLEELKH